MFPVLESNEPGDGNRHVRGALLVVTLLYASLAMWVGTLLVKSLRYSPIDDNARGLSWTAGVLLGLSAVHGTVARGASLRRGWARAWSRVLAFVIFPVFPIGTAIGAHILRNLHFGRWLTEADNVVHAPNNRIERTRER
jgi:hypothetical protein